MQSEYSEQDTERVRQAERAAAGGSAAPIAALPGRSVIAQAAPDRVNLAALALIGAGALAMLARVGPSRSAFLGGMTILTVASCFLFFALWRRVYGLLIPGCILGGLSLGVTFAGVTGGVSVLWGLALGFMAILLVGRSLFNQRSEWPIYPATVLFAIGVITAAVRLPTLFIGGLIWLPLLLIGAGLYLGWGRRQRAI